MPERRRTCHVRSLGLGALVVLGLPALAWSDPVDACKAAVFHLLTPTTGYLACDRGLQVVTTQQAELFDTAPQTADPTAAAASVESHVALTAPPSGMQASSVTFGRPLVAGHVYALRIPGKEQTVRTATGPVSTPPAGWADLTVTFSTKGKATFTPSKDVANRIFFLSSDVALKGCDSGMQVPQLVETRLGARTVAHDATLRPSSLLSAAGTESPTTRCLGVPHDGNGAPIFDPARVGDGVITLAHGAFQQAKVRLALKGVYDIFGQEIAIPGKPLAVGTVPADKDASTYYLQAAHQAGPDAKPAYAFDIKLAPILDTPVWGDVLPTLLATIDVGFGKTESSNTVALGGGLTYLHLTGRPDLPTWRLTTVGKIEADKTFKDTRNIVVQPDWRPYLPFLDNSKATRARRRYVDAWSRAARSERGDLDPDDYSADWGFSGQVSIGAELGGALGEPTVETDDKSSSVVVPAHGIGRVAPKLSATVEFKRVSVGFSTTPRYLIATETVGRILPVTNASGEQVDQARLVDVDGWQVHSETTVAIGIDRSGHIALTLAYKRGPDAPVFAKVNTVVSGLSIKY